MENLDLGSKYEFTVFVCHVRTKHALVIYKSHENSYTARISVKHEFLMHSHREIHRATT